MPSPRANKLQSVPRRFAIHVAVRMGLLLAALSVLPALMFHANASHAAIGFMVFGEAWLTVAVAAVLLLPGESRLEDAENQATARRPA